MRVTKPIAIGLIAAAAVAGAAALVSTSGTSRQAARAGTYYCPMHPTYTSDRPGDCPICNMRLVKREPAAPAPAQDQTARQAEKPADAAPQEPGAICVLHNCEKLHEGGPCPMTVVAKPGETVICPVCGKYIAGKDGTLKKVLYWTDPMIPGYKADGPGKSPMGMDLVPVYEEAAPTSAGSAGSAAGPEGYAPVLLTPQKQQMIGVRTAPVERRALTKTIRTSGRIAYDPELYQTEAEYLQSVKSFDRAQAAGQTEGAEQAKRLADSGRMKLRLMGLSQELIDEMAGWEGPDKSLLLSDANGRVWVYAPVYEFELPLVAVGQTVSVEVPAAGRRFEGIIRSVDSVLDPATRSARVRAVLTDPEGALKPEMFVDVSIGVSVGEVLAIPEEAVFHTGTQDIVFVDKGQGLFEPRRVTLGIKADGWYEVKTGVAQGEAVVASGNFLIDSESRLKAALEGASGAGHQHGQ